MSKHIYMQNQSNKYSNEISSLKQTRPDLIPFDTKLVSTQKFASLSKLWKLPQIPGHFNTELF